MNLAMSPTPPRGSLSAVALASLAAEPRPVVARGSIHRHQALVNCAFCFCWDAWSGRSPAARSGDVAAGPGRGERGPGAAIMTASNARYALGSPMDRAAVLVVGMDRGAPAAATASLMTSLG